MLVLARKEKEGIVFPQLDAKIFVNAIRGNVVRLAVEAPKTITVLRNEIENLEHSVNLLAELAEHKQISAQYRQANHDLKNLLYGVKLSIDSMKLVSNDPEKVRTLLTNLESMLTQDQEGDFVLKQQKSRILVVEDSDHERELLASTLGVLSYDVVAVGNGESAIEKLQQEKFDVILLDVRLPTVCGIEVARVARQLDNRPQIIVVSGQEFCKICVAQEAEELVDLWLKKPVGIDEIISSMETFLPAA